MMLKDDNDWQAESDARTLAEAEAIRGDSSRIERATKAAKTQADKARDVYKKLTTKVDRGLREAFPD
jgi:hypothetical protein